MVNVTVFGFLPVVPMIFGSALLMFLVSLMTKPPSKETIAKYFPARGVEGAIQTPEPVEAARV